MPATPPAPLRFLPAGVWALGFVSLLMDASSELVHSLLPLFLASTLGASVVTIGVLEGVAEATASCAKMFSGALSDRLGKRKGLVVAGYGLAMLSKPLFPLAASVTWVFTARFLDRIGKGIRGAPRDALVAEITPPAQLGAAYGLRQALDSVGAFVGPLLAVVLMLGFSNDIRTVLWFALVPAVMAVTLLVLAVAEPASPGTLPPVARVRLAELPRRYWAVVAVGGVFTLARFSEAFLVLRAQDVGLVIAYVPAVLVVMNIAYAATAYPAGRLADRMSPRTLLVLGLLVLVCADLVLATASTPVQVLVGAGCWGLHMALTQGVLAKLVAESAPARALGTAFGVFHLVTGAALLAASLIAGALWSAFGPSAAFLAGGLFSAVAAVGVVTVRA